MLAWIEEHSRNLWAGLIGLIFVAFTWFVRTFLTNQTEIALLKQTLSDIKADMARIETKTDLYADHQKEILNLIRDKERQN